MLVRTVSTGPGHHLAVTEWANPGRPPLILLHGIGSRGETWHSLAPALAEYYHLYAFDHRGHGDSGKPDNGYLLPNYAADLDAALAELRLDRPRILCHSLGALVAMAWAAANPGRADRIVLEDPPLRSEPNILEAFDGWMQLNALTVEQAAAWYAENEPGWSAEDCLRRARTITSTHPAVFSELRASTAVTLASGSVDRLDGMERIQSPVLILRGDPDAGSMTRPDDADRFASLLPTTTIHHIPGIGHSIHRDAPDPFLAASLPFLGD
jgi:pimeloyl-ACP methyl ester carboxylesterase